MRIINRLEVKMRRWGGSKRNGNKKRDDLFRRRSIGILNDKYRKVRNEFTVDILLR